MIESVSEALLEHMSLFLFLGSRANENLPSTIGPMLAAKLGIRTLDLGNPQLSMHSIRETGGVVDVLYASKLFKNFFEYYSELGAKIFVDDQPDE